MLSINKLVTTNFCSPSFQARRIVFPKRIEHTAKDSHSQMVFQFLLSQLVHLAIKSHISLLQRKFLWIPLTSSLVTYDIIAIRQFANEWGILRAIRIFCSHILIKPPRRSVTEWAVADVRG